MNTYHNGTGRHLTEVDGWVAEWFRIGTQPRLLLVRRQFAQKPLLSFPDKPDLAEVRERYPQLSRLWDAVRREYWRTVSEPIL